MEMCMRTSSTIPLSRGTPWERVAVESGCASIVLCLCCRTRYDSTVTLTLTLSHGVRGRGDQYAPRARSLSCNAMQPDATWCNAMQHFFRFEKTNPRRPGRPGIDTD